MINSFQITDTKFNNICLYLLVITTLLGPLVYISVTSLYHFYIIAVLLIILFQGINTADLKTDIMILLTLWLAESAISVLWAPDKALALQYVYYIFLIFGIGIIFHKYLNKNNVHTFSHFMVVILLVCNIVAIWELITGNHLVKDYLSSAIRMRLLEYVPGGFYRNPNDFATFIIQIIPFSLVGVSSKKTIIRVISVFNIATSFVTVCATQSRTQILLLPFMYICYLFILNKRKVIKIGIPICVAFIALYYLYPDFGNLVNSALESVSGSEISSSAATEGGSLNTRINLIMNALHILIDTVGFGIGAGCHRVVMADYSARYYYTEGILVMHNLLGEIFVDYGIFIGVAYLVAIIRSCRSLFHIFKSDEEYNIRILAILLALSLSMLIVCGISSSSILQLSSIWMTVCFTGAFINIYDTNKSQEGNTLYVRN